MLRRFLPVFAAVTFVCVPLLRAADNADTKAMESEIRKMASTMEAAFDRGDAKSVAACWTTDGEFTGPRGDRIEGRQNIEKAFSEFLSIHPKTKLRLTILSWRPLGNVLLADFVSVMTPVPMGLDAEPLSSMVLLKQDGRWLIGSMREYSTGGPSHFLHLKDLQWMVGEWAVEGKGASPVIVHSSCHWTGNGNYLIRRFTVTRDKQVLSGGTEVIGWDARAHRIRSWTFDTDGGFGEGTWLPEGNRWIVKHTGIQADGSDVAATHIISSPDANTIVFQSKDRLINGEKRTELPEVKMKRVSAQTETKPKQAEPTKVLP